MQVCQPACWHEISCYDSLMSWESHIAPHVVPVNAKSATNLVSFWNTALVSICHFFFGGHYPLCLSNPFQSMLSFALLNSLIVGSFTHCNQHFVSTRAVSWLFHISTELSKAPSHLWTLSFANPARFVTSKWDAHLALLKVVMETAWNNMEQLCSQAKNPGKHWVALWIIFQF